MKEGVEFDKTTYEIQRSYSINVDTKATVLNNESENITTILATEVAKEYIKRLEEKPDKTSCEIKKSKE